MEIMFFSEALGSPRTAEEYNPEHWRENFKPKLVNMFRIEKLYVTL
jgi:hypothetical protein